MTTNKPMTGVQLDELMAVAVRMQRDAEIDRNFPSANFAYAVQVAVLEIRRTREIDAALAAGNATLRSCAEKQTVELGARNLAIHDEIDFDYENEYGEHGGKC